MRTKKIINEILQLIKIKEKLVIKKNRLLFKIDTIEDELKNIDNKIEIILELKNESNNRKI